MSGKVVIHTSIPFQAFWNSIFYKGRATMTSRFSPLTPNGSRATLSKHGQNPKHSGKRMQVLVAEKIFTWAHHNSNALRLFYS